MIETNVDNLSSTKGSKTYSLPLPCPLGIPQVVKVNTHYSLYSRYSVWDPRTDDWWRDKANRRRTWARPATAKAAIQRESGSDGHTFV